MTFPTQPWDLIDAWTTSMVLRGEISEEVKRLQKFIPHRGHGRSCGRAEWTQPKRHQLSGMSKLIIRCLQTSIVPLYLCMYFQLTFS